MAIDVKDEQTFEGGRVVQAFHNGQMDGVCFKPERIFMKMNTLTDMSDSTVKLFEGRLIEPKLDHNTISVNLASELDDLNVQMPRNLYQPSCSNTLFDSACGLLRHNHVVSTIIEMGSTTAHQPQGWFTQGVIEFLDGGTKV